MQRHRNWGVLSTAVIAAAVIAAGLLAQDSASRTDEPVDQAYVGVTAAQLEPSHFVFAVCRIRADGQVEVRRAVMPAGNHEEPIWSDGDWRLGEAP